MSDFNDDFDPDEVADAMEAARDDARFDALCAASDEEAADAHRDERFGPGVCATGICVEPCGMDGGCIR